jgi:hypothetical protein
LGARRFELSKTNLNSLTKALKQTDFGIFVFTPDDRISLRKKTQTAIRDNVLFELGLFTGSIGSDRVFIVMPNSADDLRIPTDLIGVAPGTYDSNRKDDNLQAALGPFCNKVRRALRSRRPVKRKARQKVRQNENKRSSGGLVIHSAKYGVGDSWLNVKKPIMQRLQQFGLVRADNALAGDPQRGTAKVLRMDFTFRGSRQQADIPEGGIVQFPDD